MKRLFAGFLALLGTSCSTAYPVARPPTPWIGGHADALASSELETSETPAFFFITDRAIDSDTGTYGFQRSNAMAFGTVEIAVDNMSAQDFASYMAGTPDSRRKPRYSVRHIREAVRFPGTPLTFAIKNGVLSRDRPALGAYRDAGAALKATLAAELNRRETGKVVLYVHGFNNSFDHGALNLFEVWSASGQAGVPMVFSWPTGGRRAFGYLADTQDGAFSVYHLKETFRLIAATPEVESVTVIAHSHGASIVTSALRELLIESRGADQSMRDTYRIDTLIMAAPDIDLGVMEQRLVAETFGIGFGQINVYLNPQDSALGLARLIFGAPRFGVLNPELMSPESRAVFRGVKSVFFLMVTDASEFDRHNYFRRHPSVLSDIAMTLRTGAQPADPERPLEHVDLNFWQLDKTYAPVLTDAAAE